MIWTIESVEVLVVVVVVVSMVVLVMVVAAVMAALVVGWGGGSSSGSGDAGTSAHRSAGGYLHLEVQQMSYRQQPCRQSPWKHRRRNRKQPFLPVVDPGRCPAGNQ